MEKQLLFKDEVFRIVGAAMEVHKELGPGFLEAVYQEALELEFIRQGIPYEREKELILFYKGVRMQKKYVCDFICFDKIIVELKALKELSNIDLAITMNYLNITKTPLGMLFNFGEQRLVFKRMIMSKFNKIGKDSPNETADEHE
jgi:GxxExxY protein